MNSNSKYADIEFCTNLLFNAIYGVNDNCYQIQTIDKRKIKMEDLRKPLDYDYSDIFKGNIKEKLPSSAFINVKIIDFGSGFDQPIQDNSFPNCEKVYFGNNFRIEQTLFQQGKTSSLNFSEKDCKA